MISATRVIFTGGLRLHFGILIVNALGVPNSMLQHPVCVMQELNRLNDRTPDPDQTKALTASDFTRHLVASPRQMTGEPFVPSNCGRISSRNRPQLLAVLQADVSL